MKNTKPNYGQEMKPLLLIMTVLFITMSTVLLFLAISGNKHLTLMITPGSLSLVSAIVLITGLWSSRVGKLILRDKVISEINLKGNENVLDIITSSLAMHHITEPGIAFREMWRVLKPGGVIAIADIPIPLFRKQIEMTGFTIVNMKPLVRLFFIKMRLIIAIKN